jgi:hypothetical protein
MKNFNCTKELKNIEDWISRESNRKLFWDKPTDEIRTKLATDLSLADVGSIAFRLNLISSWPERQALLTTDPIDFKKHWSLFLNYARFAMRMRILCIEHPQGNGGISPYEILAHFILLLGNDLIDDSVWLGKRIYKSIRQEMKQPVVWTLREISLADLERLADGGDASDTPSRPSISAYSESPLCGFVLRMWLVLTGRREPMDRLPDKAPQSGIYEGLFRHWDDPTRLSDAISAACDFHVHRMKPNPRIHHDIPEFEHTPFRQIPFEILAYRNLRRRLALETPFPKHPLLDSPFVSALPAAVEPSNDPLLLEVLEYSRRLLPDL